MQKELALLEGHGLSDGQLELLEECDRKIMRALELGLDSYRIISEALATIHEQRLYLAHCRTFEEYARVRFDIGRQRAYQILQFNSIQSLIGKELKCSVSTIVDINEGISRELCVVPEKHRLKVYREATTMANQKGERLTARHVRKVAAPYRKPKTKVVSVPSEPAESEEPKLWQSWADHHKQVLSSLLSITRLLNSICEHPRGRYLRDSLTSAKQNIADLRALFSSAMPVGERNGQIVTKHDRKQ